METLMNNKKHIIILLLSISLVGSRPIKAIKTQQAIAVVAISAIGYGLYKYQQWYFCHAETKLEQAQKIIEQVQSHELMHDYRVSNQRVLKKIISYFNLRFQPLDAAELFFEDVLRNLEKADLLLSDALSQEGDSFRRDVINQRKYLYSLEKIAERSLTIIREHKIFQRKESKRKEQQAILVRLKRRLVQVSGIKAIQHNYQEAELCNIIDSEFSGKRWPLIEAKSYFTTLLKKLRSILKEFTLLARDSESSYELLANEISQVQEMIDRAVNVIHVIEHRKYEYVAQEKAHQLHLAYERHQAQEREEAACRKRQENARLQRIRDEQRRLERERQELWHQQRRADERQRAQEREEAVWRKKQEDACLSRIRDEQRRLERERQEFWYHQRREADARKKDFIAPAVEVVRVENHIHQPQPIIQVQPQATIIIEKEPTLSTKEVSQKLKNQPQKSKKIKESKKIENSKEVAMEVESQARPEKSFQSHWEEALFDSFDQF